MSDRPVEKTPQEIDQDNLPLMILEEALSWTATTFEQRMDMRTRFADALYAERAERDKRLEALERERDKLRDVLKWLDIQGGLGYEKYDRIRAALSNEPKP